MASESSLSDTADLCSAVDCEKLAACPITHNFTRPALSEESNLFLLEGRTLAVDYIINDNPRLELTSIFKQKKVKFSDAVTSNLKAQGMLDYICTFCEEISIEIYRRYLLIRAIIT